MFLSLSLCAPTVFLSQTSVGQSFCFLSLTGTKPVSLIGDAVRARPVVAFIIHYFFCESKNTCVAISYLSLSILCYLHS